jgi:hypothetical protein
MNANETLGLEPTISRRNGLTIDIFAFCDCADAGKTFTCMPRSEKNAGDDALTQTINDN